MVFTTAQVQSLKDYGFSMGSKAYLYREFGATDEQVKRFVVNSLPMGVTGIEWLTEIYMSAARLGFATDKGHKYNKPAYDLMKSSMKCTVQKWNEGQYTTLRFL